MKFSTVPVRFGTIGDVALELRKALTAIAAGWNVEHNPDGTHKESVTGVRLHAPTHNVGGTDPVTVTSLAGYPGSSTTFLRGDHTFATPSGTTPAVHHTTHEQGGSDVVLFTTGLFERGRTVAMGEWTNFTPTVTASAGTVTLTNNITCCYTLIGKTMTVTFYLVLTLSATPANLFMTLPGGAVAASVTANAVLDGPGTAVMFQTGAGSTIANIYRNPNATGTWPTGSTVFVGTPLFRFSDTLMESLELTDPVVVPEKVTAKYQVITLNLSWETDLSGVKGHVWIKLTNEHGEPFSHAYHGPEAIDLMKWMNTANFSVNSMHKRILQKLSNDGVLPGTVTGTPDP